MLGTINYRSIIKSSPSMKRRTFESRPDFYFSNNVEILRFLQLLLQLLQLLCKNSSKLG